MISAIVTSLDENNLMATPSADVPVQALIGRRVRYIDKFDKVWPAKVTGTDDPAVIIKFDVYPSGLGQGQIVEIMEETDDLEAFLRGE